MSQECIYLFALSFTACNQSGIALVSSNNATGAMTILRNAGRYNGIPDAYVLVQSTKLGLYSENRYELLFESYTNAVVAYDAIVNTISHLMTSEEFISILGYTPASTDDLYQKIDKVEGLGLSEANFTAEEKRKLGSIDVQAIINAINRITAIEKKIPSAASESNQLADKQFVRDEVRTSAATFRGTSPLNLTEQQFIQWADLQEHDLNDYAYWADNSEDPNVILYKRYRYNGVTWVFEYIVNNTAFTPEQYAAINSGINEELTNKLEALPSATELERKVDSDDIDDIVELTQAQFDALLTKDPRVMYIITNSEQDSDRVGIASLEQTTVATTDEGVNVWTCTLTNGNSYTLQVKNGSKGSTGAKGDQGNSGYSGAAGELEVVNNLTDGGSTAALSAEMGKTLKGEITQLGQEPIRQAFDLTSGGVSMTLSKTFVGGSTIYFKIVSNGTLKTGTGYAVRFRQNSTIITTLPLQPDVEYKLTLPANCNNIVVYVGSTQLQQAGTAYVDVSDGGIYYSNKQLAEVKGKVGDVQVAQLFGGGSIVSPEDFTDGLVLDSSGVPTYSASNSTTDFIAVAPSSYITFSREKQVEGTLYYYEYNADKEFIQRSADIGANLYKQLSANTAYLRFYCATTQKQNLFVYLSQNPYKPAAIKDGELISALSEEGKRVSDLSLKEGTEGKNLLSWENRIPKLSIDLNTGTIVTSTNYSLSKKIPVIPFGRYVSNANCAVFDVNDNVVDVWVFGGGYIHYAPSGASYVRATANSDSFGTTYIYYDKQIALEPYVYTAPAGVDLLPSTRLNLAFIREFCQYDKAGGSFYGKKLAIDGDSISHDQGQFNYWQYVVKNNLSMDILSSSFVEDGTTYTIGSRGIGGSRIAVGTEANTKPYCIVLRYQELPADADLIIIAGGTNDWAHEGVDLGTMADNTNVTFYGALHILCRGLIERYPSKQIVFMTPIKRGTLGTANVLGYTLEQFANAIIEVCGYYGIPVCDLFHGCTLNPSIPEQQTLYFLPNDDTHPNTLGERRMGDFVSGFVKSLV